MVDFVAQLVGLWLVLVAALFIHRRLGAARSHLKAGLVFDDFMVSGMLAMATIALLNLSVHASSIVAVIVSVVVTLWWIDGVVFCATGFNITRENLKVALQGWKTISADAPHVFTVMHRRLWSIGAPIAVMAVLLVLAGEPGISRADGILLGVATAAIVVGAGKVRVTASALVGVAALVTGVAVAISRAPSIHGLALLSPASICLLLALFVAARGQGRRFWQRRSPLRSFLGGKGLRASPAQFAAEPNRYAPVPCAQPSASVRFGALRDSNVILVALETFPAWVMEESAAGRTPALPFLSSLRERGIFSLDHYSISPNTNQAFEYLYRGGYLSEANYPYVAALRAAGYGTTLLTMQDLNDFRRFEIVDRIGFNEVVDRKNPHYVEERHDYNLFDRVDWVAERMQRGRAFIHVMNNQPHSPYVVVDQQRFGPASGDRRARFLAALAETDFIVGRWFEELARRIDLDNTLVVVVGDHGESFGELGYDMHSCATIKEQVRVPLWLLHPKLKGMTVSGRSSHLDVMPTVLDLLGIKTGVPVRGASLFESDRGRDYFLHSEVLVGGVPAQMSLLRGGRKWMTDLINGVSYSMDEEDRIQEILSDEAEVHLHRVFGKALQDHGMWPAGGAGS